MIIFNENNTNELKEQLDKEGFATVQRGSFISAIRKVDMEDSYFEITTLYFGDFFKYTDGVLGVDKVLDYLNSLSLDGRDYDIFVLKKQIKESISNGKHRIFLKRTEDENKRFIRVYKKENASDDKYQFSKLAKRINSNFSNESFYVEDMDKFIVVSSNILNCDSLKELFPSEMSFMMEVVDKHTCSYCGSTVINENFVEYLEFGECVGKDFICPECLSLYYSDYFGVINVFSKQEFSNLEKIEIVDFALKSINNK